MGVKFRHSFTVRETTFPRFRLCRLILTVSLLSMKAVAIM